MCTCPTGSSATVRYSPPMLIDEIQYATELLPYIKMRVDSIQNILSRTEISLWVLVGRTILRGDGQRSRTQVCQNNFHLSCIRFSKAAVWPHET